MGTPMKEVRFKENVTYATRSFGFGEHHVLTEEDANALGDSVEILGDAPSDFPRYDKSVYGDNEEAKEREPRDPSEESPVPVGEENPNETPALADDKTKTDSEETPETKDTEAPVNKMQKGAPNKK